MNNTYSFKDDLIKSINIAKETKGEYTIFFNPLFSKGIKFYFTTSSIDWVLRYKKLRLNDFLNQKIKLKIDVEDSLFFFIYYFYNFIIGDIWHLNKYITGKYKNILNIGAGICLFEIYLDQINKNIESFYVIEKNDLDHNKEFINVLDLAKDTINANKLENKFNFFNTINYKEIRNNFDLVVSLRSWCYLYDIETYLSFVLDSINSESTLIVDIRNKYDEKKLTKQFKDVKILTKYTDHNRFMLRKFINN
tara:strand:+ start:2893 stop:3642 length:750 start_codon:yes stop_codon:yes gene_type:complete